MARRKPKTQLQIAYQKERRRIQQFVRRAEKRGYEFNKNVVPQMPKRVTQKSLEKIRQLKPAELYKQASYGGEATFGEIVTGTEGKKAERKASAIKAAETRKLTKQLKEQANQLNDVDFDNIDLAFDYNGYYQDNDTDFIPQTDTSADTTFFDRVVIDNFKSIAEYYNSANTILNWLARVIGQYGTHATAKMIQKGAEAGVALNVSIKPSDGQGKVEAFLAELLSFMEEIGEFGKDEMMDALEAEEYYEEY